MTIRALAARFVDGPHVSAVDKAEQVWTGWLAELDEAQSAELAALFEYPQARSSLLGIVEHSPYLFDLIRSDAARLIRVLNGDPEVLLAALIETTSGQVFAAASEADAMRLLCRIARSPRCRRPCAMRCGRRPPAAGSHLITRSGRRRTAACSCSRWAR